MKQLYSLLVVLMVLILASSCVEKTGYYSDGEEDTISLICDNTWASEKTVDDEGITHHGIYNFKKDGTYSRKLIATDKDGQEKENSITGRWTFYAPSSKTIYFGNDHYWDIEEFTTKKFAVYDRWGEYGQLHMSREYMELMPLK